MTDVAVDTLGQIVIDGVTVDMSKIRVTEDDDTNITFEGMSDKHPGANWDGAESGDTEATRQMILRVDARTAIGIIMALSEILSPE